MQRVDAERRDVWLEQLEKWAPPDILEEDLHRSMTEEEIKRLAASPWATIGAHTVTHSALSALTGQQQQEEITSSAANKKVIVAVSSMWRSSEL